MWLLNNFLQLFQIIFISTNYIFYASAARSATATTTVKPNYSNVNEANRIPIGVVLDQSYSEIQHGFKIAMLQHSNKSTSDYLDFEVFVDVINTADAFKLSRLVCKQFSRGVVALLADVHPDSFDSLHAYANSFNMPFLTPAFPEKVKAPSSGLPDNALSILPDYHKAVLGVLKFYGWKNVIYLYDSDDGMLRLQKLFKTLVPGKPPYFRIANVKQINSAMDVINYLKQLEKVDRWSNKNIILDCDTTIAKETIITHVRDAQLGRRNYHYLFSRLVLDEPWDKKILEYGSINITGFRLIDESRKFVKDFFKTWNLESIPANGLLMYDAAHTVLHTFLSTLKYKPHIIENLMNRTNNDRYLTCDAQEAVPLKYGEEITEFMKKTQVEGLSGKIRFSSEGVRQNFSLSVVRNTPGGSMIKIATWYDERGFRPLRKLDGLDVFRNDDDYKKLYTVLSIHEPPYFISNKPKLDFHFDTDVLYRGFCAELAELIAEKLEINIQFQLSTDGKYGNLNPSMFGGWDGMVGELVRREVDMVVAPLMVTAEREAVVDFSKAFLSFNRIAPKNPKENVSMFSFLRPLSKETWVLLAVTVVLVGVAIYIVSRFSPLEWRVVMDSEAPVTRFLCVCVIYVFWLLFGNKPYTTGTT